MDVMTYSVSKISSFVTKVDKIIFEVAQMTFKVAQVADISLLVVKITFAASEIITKEDVITSQMISKLSVILTEL